MGRRIDDEGQEFELYEAGEPLGIGEKIRRRDLHRWELDPASAEDYAARLRTRHGESERVLHMGHVYRFGRP